MSARIIVVPLISVYYVVYYYAQCSHALVYKRLQLRIKQDGNQLKS